MFYSSRNPHSFSFAFVQATERVIHLDSEVQNAHGEILTTAPLQTGSSILPAISKIIS